MLVWKVQDGPYNLDEDVPDVMADMMGDWPFRWWLIVMATDSQYGEPYDTELWFETFNDAYEFAEAVRTSMEPLEVSDNEQDRSSI